MHVYCTHTRIGETVETSNNQAIYSNWGSDNIFKVLIIDPIQQENCCNNESCQVPKHNIKPPDRLQYTYL